MVHPLSRLCPLVSVKLIKLYLRGFAAGVLLYQVKLGGRQVEISSVGVLYLDVVLAHIVPYYVFKPSVYAYAVVFMHHIIPGFQLI